MKTKFQFTKFGLKHDPRGAHVTLGWQGRTLIGEVLSFERNETRGCILLNVKHFDGSMWPVQPHALAVDVLIRREA